MLDPRGHGSRAPEPAVHEPPSAPQVALGGELGPAPVELAVLRAELPAQRAVLATVTRQLGLGGAAVLVRDLVDTHAAPAVCERVDPDLPVLVEAELRVIAADVIDELAPHQRRRAD